ncbi:MAG TPA: glycyl-radical enzyme activating protein [Spirochaetia bacterium]|nr:glycyl-radical enzyme activating protein [Spirochaetia bacterium]
MDNNRGLIFHVIRGSFVDGYGIRTTIFLKGCPLRCVWCCNPEGQQVHAEVKFTVSKCDGCGRCVQSCPVQAIQIGREPGDNRVTIDRELCTNCGRCTEVCYTGALECFGKYFTVDELFDVVKKDEQFYRASGGGVTIGGGEPTYQPSFTLEFIKKCRANYIHTALDTCGYTATRAGVRVLEEADLVLFDIKGMDTAEHVRSTGAANEIILQNLKHLDVIGKPLIIRVPVIPGYTDSQEGLKSVAGFLAGLKHVERVDLLAVHEYGKVKYEQLGMEYKLKVQPLGQERLGEIKALFEGHGLNVQLGG